MVVLAVYGAFKAYMYFDAKSHIDQILKFPKMAGIDVHYDRISTSILGTIGIQGLKFRLPQINEEISFGEVVFYKFEQQEDKMPTRLRFRMDDIHFNLDLFDKLAKLSNANPQANQHEGVYEETLANLGYAEINQRGNDWRRLGYSNVVMDMAMDFQFRPALDEATISMNFEVDKLGDFKMTTEITEAGFTKRPSFLGVKIKEFRLDYLDHSYIDRIIKSFADERKLDLETFRQQVINNVDTEVATKQIKLSPESIQNLKAFLAKPDRITVTMYPYKPVLVGSIKHYSPGDVPLLLNLRFIRN